MCALRRKATTALVAVLSLTLGVAPALAVSALAASPAGAVATGEAPPISTGHRLPQDAAARAAAGWLAGRLTAAGYIPESGSTKPTLSATANTVLALSASEVDLPGARTALGYLEAHIAGYITAGGADGPGQLAQLILDTVAMGTNPRTFGGYDLVTSLLSTEQVSGVFGTTSQLSTYYAGTYDQGLALAALAAAGVRGTAQVQSAVAWLDSEQCPGGGWTLPDQALNPCTGTPATFAGPDTNSTALAVEGLVAQHSLDAAASAGALGFYESGQDADGGWSYYSSTTATPQTTQPTSTALVIQALLALGTSPTAGPLTKGTATPVSTLLSFQLTPSGAAAGAFTFPGTTTAPNLIATYETVPALAGLAIPFGPGGGGYDEVAADGGIFAFGNASFHGSMGGKALNAPVVGIAATPTGGGYWEVASDGGIFAFGNASFHGSMGGKALNAPVVGIAATPTGGGYWEVASDGGIFAFGNASFHGSMGGKALNAPVVGIAATPTGGGYWEVASDGGIFAFGNASFHGSMGGKALNAPVVGIAATPTGGGYWEVASDGGIFAFGNASFHGSMGGKALNAPVVGIAATPTGGGYWEVASDGGIFAFGNASFHGSMGGKALNAPVVGIAAGEARPV